LNFIFWISIFALLHTYIFYPLLLKFLANGRSAHHIFYKKEIELPVVSIIMSLYNEETVIKEKLESLLAIDYPAEKLFIYIGSDCSADETNAIVAAVASEQTNIFFFPFQERRGKPSVINDLSAAALKINPVSAEHIFLITDANVILTPQTVKQLVRHFKDEKIAVVDANMVNTGLREQGISKSEKQYISSEVYLKYREGLVWGKMMGPFGGCYTIRTTHFSTVPGHFLVDDFYITMRVFEKGGQAINDLEAVVYEAASHDMGVEFRRKARIAAGSYQNLFTFPHLWLPKWSTLNFAFFSHKVLRWWGPFFMIFILISSLVLAYQGHVFFQLVVIGQAIFYIIIPILDKLLRSLGHHQFILRSLTYFITMNMALLKGFFKFLNGIEAGVWERTKRET
jgi:cellulose synthase/poly-beta-1,6-N-acetylglucosamine synthase-like glycosyltransferase